MGPRERWLASRRMSMIARGVSTQMLGRVQYRMKAAEVDSHEDDHDERDGSL